MPIAESRSTSAAEAGEAGEEAGAAEKQHSGIRPPPPDSSSTVDSGVGTTNDDDGHNDRWSRLPGEEGGPADDLNDDSGEGDPPGDSGPPPSPEAPPCSAASSDFWRRGMVSAGGFGTPP
jgi:hypothetical protein